MSDDDDMIRRRKSYIKEEKLRAIAYVIIIWKDKNEIENLISKRLAAKNLEIIIVILRQWIKIKFETEKLQTKARKNRRNNKTCQKLERKTRLIKLLKQKRLINRRILKACFFRQAKQLYRRFILIEWFRKVKNLLNFSNLNSSSNDFETLKNELKFSCE
jgi:hypothetical protein